MIVEELRKSILNYAIAGFLSKQNLGEKCNICCIDSINDPELFSIPNNWKWLKIKDIGDLIRGNGIKRTETTESGVQCIRYGEIYTNYSYSFNNSISFVSNELANTCKSVKKGDVLLTLTGENEYDIAKATTYLGNDRLVAGGDMAILTNHNQNPLYLSYFFASPFAIKQKAKTAKGNIIVHTSTDKIGNYFIPLPPIEEQQRIVDKIEELFDKLDEIRPIEEELKNSKNNFPNDMKKSIIQSAVSGQLTSQNTNESVDFIVEKIENKINKKIRSVSNHPFVIPNNWIWIKFGDLVTFEIGKTPPRADNSFWDGEFNWVSISDMVENGIINDTKETVSSKANNELFKGKISKSGTLLMSFKLTVGRCSILGIDAYHNEGIISIYPNCDYDIIKKYLFKILPFIVKFGDTKGAIKGNTLNSKSLDNLMIPLPPLEEQQRIVEKLEQLLPLCNDIENLVSGE